MSAKYIIKKFLVAILKKMKINKINLNNILLAQYIQNNIILTFN